MRLLQAFRSLPVTVSLHVDDHSIYIEQATPSQVAATAKPVLAAMETELART
jgi:hypothetical protein